MPAAIMTLGMGPQRFGRATRRSRVPFGPLAVSTIAHVVLIIGVVAGAAVWRTTPTKPYVVNLAPAVAAVGAPRPEPALPPRTTEPVTTPKELPSARELPPVRDMPVRDMPSRTAALPERTPPPPTPALPRPGDKELPSVASAAPKPAPVLPPPTTPARAEPPSAPPIGSPMGSPQGAGTVTLNVADFPYAWDIQAVHRKIQERWEGRAIEGRQPEVIFEIERNGRLRRVAGRQKTGDTAPAQLPPRAGGGAAPLPPLAHGVVGATPTDSLAASLAIRGH